jgi:GNAT superfamily N-acetyltransferase
MNNIVIKEVTNESLEASLEIRNAIFPPITVEEWKRRGDITGAVAFAENRPVGFIPLFLRDVKIAPNVTLTAAYENSVGTKEEYRGQGIGGKMIDGCVTFLQEKADALYVYRGDERSRGYHFYEKTGHVDLLYTRSRISDTSFAKQNEDVKVTVDMNEILQKQATLAGIFNDAYFEYGGFPERIEGYWEKAFSSPYYVGRPADFYLFELVENNAVTAYLIASIEKNPLRKMASTRLSLLEMASQGADEYKIKRILESAAAFAEQKELEGLYLVAGDEGPFVHVWNSLGFEASPRSMQEMALIINSKALFEKLWKDRFQLTGIDLEVWTPQQDFQLLHGNRPEGRNQKMVIEMKEDMLTRWLMGRVDFIERVKEGTISVQNGNQRVIEAIAKAIPHNKWEYHHLDYC